MRQGALNRSKILNVSVAEPPNRPVSPSYPIVPLNLGVGLLLALGLRRGRRLPGGTDWIRASTRQPALQR